MSMPDVSASSASAPSTVGFVEAGGDGGAAQWEGGGAPIYHVPGQRTPLHGTRGHGWPEDRRGGGAPPRGGSSGSPAAMRSR